MLEDLFHIYSSFVVLNYMTIDIVPIYNIDIVIESQQRLRQETFTATLPEV